MSQHAQNQARAFLALFDELRPHLRADRNLPARIQQRLARDRRFGSRDRRLYRELLYTAIRHLPWFENTLNSDSGAAGEAGSDRSQMAGNTAADGKTAADKNAVTGAAAPAAVFPQSAFRNLHSAFRNPHSAFRPPHSAAGIPQSAFAALLWLAADTPATLPLKRALIPGAPPAPATPTARAALLGLDAAALLPAWFREHCPDAFAPSNLDALNTRAPLWLRLQTGAPAPVLAEFDARGWPHRASPELPGALELLAPDADVTQTDAHQRGLVEIQDLGSQLLLPIALSKISSAPGTFAPVTPAPPFTFPLSAFARHSALYPRWLDACAGAGGKTLQLARLLGPAAQIDATDPRPAALDELSRRAARARLKNIRVLPPARPPAARYDAILIDAPCSGTGTWRRAPHLKWTTTDAGVRAAARLQLEILSRHAPLVRPAGGLLLYATCSLSRHENEAVTARFLETHPAFRLLHSETLLPAARNTDGFHIAILQKPASPAGEV
ncbi:MAG: RsmB/NOP family class I SAM-dependent RNA methyltransferase [Opitutaceae bacterium]|nr:RsmB/NOP family class I SAM-dependent RNA methyltransferase [Opitutaceae bacterium]